MTGACGPGMRNGAGGDDGTTDGGGSGGSGGSGGGGSAQQCNKMDIVFVVDDSGSMSEEQSNLATNFPAFANVLSTFTLMDGTPIDFRIGLTTTGRTVSYTVTLPPPIGGSLPQNETGDNGVFRNDCGPSTRWLDGTDASLSSDLACRANVGTSGPSVEMPMLMSNFALDAQSEAGAPNNGFLRDDALLAVVMITDEDDWSQSMDGFTVDDTGNSPVNYNPPDEVAFLDQLKGNRSRWAAAVIAGDGNCSSSFGAATDAVRLKQFVSLANGQGSTQAVFSSICDGDLSIGLTKALNTFQAACGEIIF